MPATPLEPAGLLYAHYEVLRDADGSPRLLGRGGMGMTYLARDPRLDLLVALKVIHPLHVSHPQAHRLFRREARAAARVIHANVAPVVYLHDEPGRFFYAMEFVDGMSLESFLRERGQLPAPQALGFAPGHARHRALAASGGCALKIIDFGLARHIETALGTDEPLTIGFRGTAAYSSPEQCEERADLDARADLASTLAVNFSQGGRALIARQPTANRDAYEAFLRARSLRHLRNADSTFAEQAIAPCASTPTSRSPGPRSPARTWKSIGPPATTRRPAWPRRVRPPTARPSSSPRRAWRWATCASAWSATGRAP